MEVKKQKPNMKQAMSNWLDKTNKSTKEWLPVCKLLSTDDAIQSFCLKLAEDYENKKMPELEFLASLATTSGKSLEEIDKILADVASGQQEVDKEHNIPVIAHDDHAHYDREKDTIYLPDDDGNNWIRLQHETGHRELGHKDPEGIEKDIVWPAAVQEIEAWEYAVNQRPDIPKQFIADGFGTYTERVSMFLGPDKYHEILQIASNRLGIGPKSQMSGEDSMTSWIKSGVK